jgi:hypothetical protein
VSAILLAGTTRTRRWVGGALLVLAIATFAALQWRAGASTTGAETLTFEWEMKDRFDDFGGDGVLDERDDTAYLKPSSWDITFTACDSDAAGTAPPGSTYRWRFMKGSTTLTKNGGCEVTQAFPSLGTWNVSVEIRLSGGGTHASTAGPITPVDHFIVSLGDSIGSGEGNPDTVGPGTLAGFPFYEPVWQDKECHRTALAGSAQAALRLERRDPHSAVTFLHLACSGATVQQGLLGPYEGVEPDTSDGDDPAQLARAVELADGRPIDAMVISIGANNAKFADMVGTCV